MSLQGLYVDGIDFRTRDGQVFKMVGVSDFALPKRWFMPDGPRALVAPRLDEWKQIAHEGGYDGPITLRCMRHASPSATGKLFSLVPATMPLDVYKRGIRDLLEFCDERGFYVELTGGDAQELWPSKNRDEADPSALQEHLNEVCEAIVDVPNVVLEVLNERFKNGRAYGVHPPKHGTINPLVRASGFYADRIQDWPQSLVYDYVTYHGTRTVDQQRWPKTVFDMPVQASVLNKFFGKAAVLNEPFRFDDGTDPEWAARIGLTIAWCAGVFFHSQRGRDGDGFHDAPGQRAAAVRYFSGIRGGLIAAGLTR
jgi:hypothetical protein